MKKYSLLFLTALLATGASFPYHFTKSDGTAMTNAATVLAYPPNTSSVSVVGTNIVVGGAAAIPLNPSTNGDGTLTAQAGGYRVFFDSLNFGFLVNLPSDNSSNLPLSAFVYNAPVVYTAASFFGVVTNALGFLPATRQTADLIAYLNFQPATNSISAIAALLTYGSLSNALGFLAATNGGGLSWQQISNALGYMPAANTYGGITNALTFAPATNGAALSYSLLPYTPPTNTPAGLAYVLGYTPQAALGYTPMSNNFYGVTNALGYKPLASTVYDITNALKYQPLDPTNFSLTNLGWVRSMTWETNGTTTITNLTIMVWTNAIYRP